ncbi:MAG TPA: PepSY domain-containing protein [Gemmatimonadales bacterium]
MRLVTILALTAGFTVCAAGVAAAQQPAADSAHRTASSYKREVPAALLAQVKISEDSARALALASAPDGTVQALELEREHGKLIWSFDIKIVGKPGITEVNVNALDGSIVGIEHEAH